MRRMVNGRPLSFNQDEPVRTRRMPHPLEPGAGPGRADRGCAEQPRRATPRPHIGWSATSSGAPTGWPGPATTARSWPLGDEAMVVVRGGHPPRLRGAGSLRRRHRRRRSPTSTTWRPWGPCPLAVVDTLVGDEATCQARAGGHALRLATSTTCPVVGGHLTRSTDRTAPRCPPSALGRADRPLSATHVAPGPALVLGSAASTARCGPTSRSSPPSTSAATQLAGDVRLLAELAERRLRARRPRT